MINSQVKNNNNNEVLFDGDDFLFKSLIKDVKIYFEYGSGLSTIYVYKNSNCKIFTVDTSKLWVKKIKKLTLSQKSDRLNIKWVNVGDVGDWGYPKSFIMRENFLVYANWFWKKNQSPDLVLIDGRFRVFCFLTTLKYAPQGTKILFDDYLTRPFYHLVEEFLPVIDRCGRQVLFETSLETKNKISDQVLLSFQNVIG